MFWISTILLSLGSLLALEFRLAKKYPGLSKNVEKLLPFASMLGVFLFLIGASGLLDAFIHPAHWLIQILTSATMLVLGYLFGLPTLERIVAALSLKWNIAKLYDRVNGYREQAGVLGLAMVVINLLTYFKFIG